MSLFVGIDLGTSGCRAVAIDDQRRVQAQARCAFAPLRRQGPRSEQHPHEWWQAVETVLTELAGQVGGGEVAAVAVDGTSASVLACDADGEPLGPALLYNDTRAREQAARVDGVAPAASPARGPGASLAKALYLLERYPQTRFVLHQAEWVAGRLCGRYGLGDENNCLKMGYDPVQGHWPSWMGSLGVEAQLPRVQAPASVLGPMQPPLARRLGWARQPLVVAGTTDSTAAVLATGAADPGEGITSLGSTLVVKVITSRPVFAAAYGVYSHRVGRLWIAGGASNSGGAVLAQHFGVDELDSLSARIDPDTDTGLDYYPLAGAGERFPVNDPDWPPRIEPRPADRARFLQGLLEGIAHIEARGYGLLAELGAEPVRSVRTVGGGARNPAWARIRARILGVPLIEPEHTEAAYGAALLALRGARTADAP